MRRFKIIVEEHQDDYVAYPLGLSGIVVGQGDTYDNAVADVKSAIEYHIESFGTKAFEEESDVLRAFITDAEFVD